MKKLILFASAVALVALSSCTNEDAVSQSAATSEDDNAISFGTYIASSSRAENTDYDDVQDNGFGVFAYYTDQTKIENYIKDNYTPNFMINQKVAWQINGTGTPEEEATGNWRYSPIKYWPNNPGAMLSFFAYAPYIEELTDDKYLQDESKNNYMNNVPLVPEKSVRLHYGSDYYGPGIEYSRPADPTKGIDLLWGEYQQTYKGDNQTTIEETYNGGKAAIDQTKYTVENKVQFQFHHALSRLHFNVQVWADEATFLNEDVKNSTLGLAKGTHIKIDKVELVGAFPKAGVLRLYDGTWNVQKDSIFQTIEFSGDQLNSATQDITEDAASNEIDLLAGKSMEDGIQLPDEQINNFVMTLPTETNFFIRLTYTVSTYNEDGTLNGTPITNTVCSNDPNALIYNIPGAVDAFSSKNPGQVEGLKAGYAYDFHLNIGMTTVKFDAQVDDWKRLGNEVDLPANTSSLVP